jgi:uncharacterized membrane protein (DUF2068 family)
LIIAYKLGRAILSVVGGVGGLVLVGSGLSEPLQRSAGVIHDHAVSALALWLTGLVVSAVEPKHLAIISVALVFDAALLFVEGWALYKGRWWGAWLVVVASGALVPFELVALVRHPAGGRALLVLVNGAIVAWLARHALRRPGAAREP